MNIADVSRIKPEDLGKETSIKFEVLPSEDDVYADIAAEMAGEVRINNQKGKKTAFICPVGPVYQYEKFVDIVMKENLSLKNVYIFNMDEYLDDNRQYIPKTHPLSFRGFMDRELYNRIPAVLNIPEDHRFFPEPGHEDFIWEKIQEIGGIDICFGGIGINGHIAFNEPPEEGECITDEEFVNLKSRILRVARETRAVNSMGGARGDIRGVPAWCITIGMKEIFSSRKIRLSMYRVWQSGILRHVMHGPVTAKVPASFIQRHPDVRLVVTRDVAMAPEGKLK